MSNAAAATNSVLASIFVLSLLLLFLVPYTLCVLPAALLAPLLPAAVLAPLSRSLTAATRTLQVYLLRLEWRPVRCSSGQAVRRTPDGGATKEGARECCVCHTNDARDASLTPAVDRPSRVRRSAGSPAVRAPSRRMGRSGTR